VLGAGKEEGSKWRREIMEIMPDLVYRKRLGLGEVPGSIEGI
jgi:hypothetical protein